MRATSTRGASSFEYMLMLCGVVAIGLIGSTALGGSSRDVAKWEGGCVKTFDCSHHGGGNSSGSIAPVAESSPTGMASDAWRGVRAELGSAGSETVEAALSPGDVVRGLGFLASHPGQGFRALIGKRKSAATTGPAPSTTENTARSGARVASTVSPAVIGRLGKIGRIVASGGTREQWAELDALADGEEWQP
jgi:hypothetical protein